MSMDGKLPFEAKAYFDLAFGYHERMTKAESDLQRALGRLAVIHDITQDPNVTALDKVDNIAATAASALSSHQSSTEAI